MKRYCRSSWLLLLVIVLNGCGNGANEQRVRQLQVEDFQYVQRPSGDRLLRGTLVNPLPETVRNVQIEVSLLDADNRRVETALIAVDEVPGEGRVSFQKIIDVEREVQGARIRQIRGL